MLKIAFDFDGVCTDLSHIRSAGVNLHEYLYSPVAISVANPRPGFLPLLSLVGLIGEIAVLSARPRDHHHEIEEWLWRNGVRHLVGEVVCCGSERKADCMARHNFSTLIEDDLVQVNAVRTRFPVVHWEEQSWLSVATDVFGRLLAGHRAPIAVADAMVLTGAEVATEWGASHVLFLNGEDGGRLKVRVCRSEQERNRLVGFLDATARHRYPHVARLVAVNGLAVVKSFVPGRRIDEFTESARGHYIAKTGGALASLHAIPADSVPVDVSLSSPGEPKSLLACAADNHNLIVTPDDEVVFIDLGACAGGSRWVDLCWAEDLLCRNEHERAVLWTSYLSASCSPSPSRTEIESARRSYRVWLTHQLLQAEETHNADSGKHAAIRRTIAGLWARSG